MRLLAWVSVASLIVDQLSKQIVVEMLDLKRLGTMEVLPPWLNFRMAWNRGVNFGLLSDDSDLTRWGLIAIALVIVVWILGWMHKSRPGPAMQLAAGLLIGGAIGNVIDRLRYGAVADFLNMSLPGWQNPYSFNVADVAIFAGAAGMVLLSGKKHGATDR